MDGSRRETMRRVLQTVLLLIVAVWLALALLAVFSDRLIFHPQSSTYRDADLAQQGAQVFKLRSGDKTITAAYLPNAQARYTLLFSHGNAEDLGDDLPLLKAFRSAGYGVFAYDYRGYGTSEGTASEKAVYQDVTAAYDYLTRTLSVPPERVISFGRSLGSAAAIELAATRPVAGLIVEAPFLSAFRVITRVQLLPWDKFENARKMRHIRQPVLVIHGRNDGIVPFWHGQRIYDLASQPKRSLWIDRAGHNDVLFVAQQQYFDALRDFGPWLDQLSNDRQAAP